MRSPNTDPGYHSTHFCRQLEASQFKAALTRIDTLLTELKKLDDKMILTEVHLLESRVYRGIGNFTKSKVRLLLTCRRVYSPKGSPSKAALTSARTAANSIYCPPHLQAALDLQSGVLHAEDKDYSTAYSYFIETFENMTAQDDPAALTALKYMLLCKVMLNLVGSFTTDVQFLLIYSSNSARGRHIASICETRHQVCSAARNRMHARDCDCSPKP